MAHILRSNKALLNAENALYITDKGMAKKSLTDFYNSLSADGYILNQSQFDALKFFENEIEPYQSKILEIYPFLGSTVEAQMTKLKFKNTSKCVPINGLNDTMVDNAKGLNWASYLIPAKGINTGLKDADFPTGFGFILYGQYPSYTEARGLFGKGNSILASDLMYISAGNEIATSNNGSAKAVVGSSVVGSGVLASQYIVSGGVITHRKLYKGDNVVFNEADYLPLTNSTMEYGIAMRGNTSATNVGEPFFGKIRFGMVTNGNLLDTEYKSVVASITTLMSALEKSFI